MCLSFGVDQQSYIYIIIANALYMYNIYYNIIVRRLVMDLHKTIYIVHNFTVQ